MQLNKLQNDFFGSHPPYSKYTYPTLSTFAWRLITIYSVMYYIIHNMCCINFLPPVSATSHSYSLRKRAHSRQLPDRLSRLVNCIFIVRMLFYQSAFMTSFTVNDVNNCVLLCSNAVYILLRRCNCGLSVINKRICYVMLYIGGVVKCSLTSI